MSIEIGIGVDLGLLTTKQPSSAVAAIAVDVKRRHLRLAFTPQRYSLASGAVDTCVRTIVNTPDSHVHAVVVDAPITPKLHAKRPQRGRGRSIDRVFSRGILSNARRGLQPSSICDKMIGWPLYCSGMHFVRRITDSLGLSYIQFTELKGRPRGVLEGIPKLTQGLIAPITWTNERSVRVKIDDALARRTFSGESPWILERIFWDFSFDQDLCQLCTLLANNPRKHHEELAALLMALQASLYIIGRAEAVGCGGAFEGYYVLPSLHLWDVQWHDAFALSRNRSPIIDVVPLAGA